jgi:hypothetical protein
LIASHHIRQPPSTEKYPALLAIRGLKDEKGSDVLKQAGKPAVPLLFMSAQLQESGGRTRDLRVRKNRRDLYSLN